jgi:hypothetical protein
MYVQPNNCDYLRSTDDVQRAKENEHVELGQATNMRSSQTSRHVPNTIWIHHAVNHTQRHVPGPCTSARKSNIAPWPVFADVCSINILNIVAYLLHARTVQPKKQPLPSNIRTQQYNNRVMHSVSRQRLGKHISAYRTVLCNAVTSSTIRTVFSVGSVHSAYRRSEFRR